MPHPTETRTEPGPRCDPGHWRSTVDVDKLFTLSQIGLLRLHRALRHLQMDLRFAGIEYSRGLR
jgi:hypothetical protein